MVFRLLAVLAEFERDVISERTSMAMKHMRACGRYTGGQAPFGFLLTANGDLEPIAQEQAVINRVRDLRTRGGASLRKISSILGQEGHLSRTGRKYLDSDEFSHAPCGVM